MNEQPLALVCKAVKFCHQFDEDAFFDWIKKIPSIISFEYPGDEGIRDELHLTVKSARISDEDLRAIIGLFCKYDIDMRQLKVFINEDNKSWIRKDGKGYWNKRIFIS